MIPTTEEEAVVKVEIEGLAVCGQPHGAPWNRATVYGHGAGRTCLRLFGTKTWVYDPRFETETEDEPDDD